MSDFDLFTVKRRMSIEQLIAWIKHPNPAIPKIYSEPLESSEEQDSRDIATYVHSTL